MEPIEILYEDNHLIAINKRSSDLAQGDASGDAPLADKVAEYLKVKYHKPGNVFVGVTHRLDRPVSGVMIFARTSKALERMNKLFKEKSDLEKIYWAIVEKRPQEPQGKLVNYLRKNEKQNKSYVCEPTAEGAKEAQLEYKLLDESDKYYLLEVKLLTGRHHQIRVQLANIGCIIKGDLKYGARRSNPDGSISLHARRISFTHPVSKQPVSIVAPTPEDSLWKYFENRQTQG